MPIKSSYDVVVVGGGPAGYPAAIQAARMGARVLLLEKSGQLGGATTLNRVAFPGIFHAWGRQVIAGIGWDLVCRAVQLEGRNLPDFSDIHDTPWKHQVSLCPALLAGLIDEAVDQAGCDVLFHVMPASLSSRSGGGWKIQVCGKEGLFCVESSFLIDATGDANVARFAGCALLPASENLQPGTLVFRLEGYDSKEIHIPELDRAAAKALEEGFLKHSDFGWVGQTLASLIHNHGENSIHVPQIDAVDSAGKTKAEIAGRAALLRVFRFLKTQPGFESLKIAWCAPECGIRETRSIVGRSVITHEDYLSGRKWKDAVCYSFYPIDLHTDDGLKYERLKEGVLPSIPLSAMLPVGIQGLIVAGRCISGDRMANSAFRVQASCMAMGQAAGAAAALAVKKNDQNVEHLSLNDLRQTLENQGAIFPEN